MEVEQPPSIQQQPKPKQQHLEWRRNRVLELTSQGRTERELAQILSIGNGTVHRDLAYLNKQARENLQVHIQERLPEQYQKCMNGLTQVLKMAWNIAVMDNTNTNNHSNQAIKLQALSLINDCYKYQMDLTTNGSIITDAMKRITQLQDNVNIINKCDKSLEIESLEASEAEEATTNGVF
jgi:DeoR/GlpR family transcriptional regulator of sugar metabolism